MWNLKQQQTNKTLTDTDNRLVVTRGEKGWGIQNR